MKSDGIVYLVGAGPGDPELLTLKGERVLRTADVVVYDRLVDDRLIALAPTTAELINVGKVPGSPQNRQEKIIALLIDKARAGNAVVRLKGGDPFVFGRGGEEGVALAEADLTFEVVPAATSAIAAPAYAGIPVTHRGLASSVTFVTGNEDPEKPDSTIDWTAIANTGGTIVVMMGRDNLHRITGALINGGRDIHTPAAIVRWGSKPNQHTIVGTLYDIAARADDAELPPPVVLVIGQVVNLRPKLNWFERLPLFGKRVLVTRTREQGSSLTKRLGTLGALPIEVPTVEIEALRTSALDGPIQHLSEYDWLVFTSANAVEIFFTELIEKGRDARALGPVKIAAIGPATADSLRNRGITSDLLPSTYSSEALAEMFSGFDLLNKKVLIPRSAEGGDPITNKLTTAGALVEDVPIYRPATPPGTSETLTRHLHDGIDIATFTSSSTVTNLINLLGGAIQLRGVTIACIGPMTAETAESHGLNVDIVASVHTVDGLVDALVEKFESQT